MLAPTYKLLVDWDNDGGLSIGDFEFDVDGWVVGGTVLPTFARSTVRSYHGDASGLITWGAGGTLPLVQRTVDGLTSGTQYTLSAWVYVPAGSIDVLWAVAGVTTGVASVTTGAWTEITLTFTATASIHLAQIWPETSPAGGEQAWVDLARITGPGEDVTSRLPERSEVTVEYGRDQARSLSPARPGEAEFELDNESRDYSPENTGSPLAGKVGPGRNLVLQATHDSKAYTLYRGHLDDFQVHPDKGDWSVSFSALDGLARFKSVKVSTALYPAVRTGEAIGYVLDALGWTAGRDIDLGATTIRWWWEENENAFEVLERLVNSEGPGAFMHIGTAGEFIFRDRHHRLTRTASTAVQATFRDSGAEPLFEQPFEYDYGWRDIINHVEFRVDERAVAAGSEAVWTDSEQYRLASWETRQFHAAFEHPVHSIYTPTNGAAATNPDFVVSAGSILSITLSRTSGQSVTITVSAGVSGATVDSMQLRGFFVGVVRTVIVSAEDTTSIAKHGRRTYDEDVPWLGRNDAAAIADLILGQRAERLPIVRIRTVNSSSTALTQQLARDLSDRVRIIEAETGLDSEFYIDQIEHRISENALLHETVFGCEEIATLPGNVFMFDVTGRGFNDGVFATTGIDDHTKVFRFDHATQGQFDVGVFGN